MTAHKDRKADARARMAATGEPYAEAARQLRGQPGGPLTRTATTRIPIRCVFRAMISPGCFCSSVPSWSAMATAHGRTWPITTSHLSVSQMRSTMPARIFLRASYSRSRRS
jgi:hypothetical protein